MSLILTPGKTTLALAADQVRWFLNGKAFLKHVQDLPTVKLAAYCQWCYAHGHPDDVLVGKVDDDTYIVRCDHRQQRIARASVTETDALLARLGWSLRCDGDCAAQGMFDGVEANNDPQMQTVRVSCGCTDRLFHVTGVVH